MVYFPARYEVLFIRQYCSFELCLNVRVFVMCSGDGCVFKSRMRQSLGTNRWVFHVEKVMTSLWKQKHHAHINWGATYPYLLFHFIFSKIFSEIGIWERVPFQIIIFSPKFWSCLTSSRAGVSKYLISRTPKYDDPLNLKTAVYTICIVYSVCTCLECETILN